MIKKKLNQNSGFIIVLCDNEYLFDYISTTASSQLFLSTIHISVMFTGLLLLNLIRILQNFSFKLFFRISFVYFLSFVCLFCSSHSASISTLNNLSSLSSYSNQDQFMSNNSYQNFILRQYFIDLLNISHTSIVQSMVYNHHLTRRSISSKNFLFV